MVVAPDVFTQHFCRFARLCVLLALIYLLSEVWSVAIVFLMKFSFLLQVARRRNKDMFARLSRALLDCAVSGLLLGLEDDPVIG